jgi:hypothetical protein
MVSDGYGWERLKRGRASTSFWRHVFLAFRDGVGQGYVGRESWGWMHYTFMVAFIGTSLIFVNKDIDDFLSLFGLRSYFYYGDFYRVFKAAMDTFFALIIVGAAAAGIRRALIKPSVLAPNQSPVIKHNFENYTGYWLPLTLLLPLTGLLLEGARINATQPKFTEWAYIGRNIARIEGALGAGVTFHRWLWLVHVLLVYGLLFCRPFTKLRHFLIAPVNLFFRNLGQRGRLMPIKDFESAETFGVSQIEQYTWKQLLDMGACLECGRCTINCPTANTGNALNPKFLVISQREHLLDKAPYLLAARAADAALTVTARSRMQANRQIVLRKPTTQRGRLNTMART